MVLVLAKSGLEETYIENENSLESVIPWLQPEIHISFDHIQWVFRWLKPFENIWINCTYHSVDGHTIQNG